MPIGFSDLLKTTAQLNNSLTKGIVSTDDTYGGIRSKIDDWTDLHLSTYNNGAGRTFQDDGTSTSPGHFKAYSTMFYVADGRALVEDANASSNFIRLDASGNYVAEGGTKYIKPTTGTAEPEYWVLADPTEIGGTGTGTDKLPTFTITGTQGNGSTAIPAGYQKLQVLTNAASDPGGSGYNSTIGVNTDLDTSGAQVIDTISLTDGVIVSDITTRLLTLGDLGYTGATDANNYTHPTQSAITVDSDTGALTGATVISDIDIDITVDTLGHVTAATYTTDTRTLTLSDLGYTGDPNAQANVGTDLAIGTSNGTTQQITSSTGNDVNLVVASASFAGIVTTDTQTFAGDKTFNNNVTIGGNLTVVGDVVQQNSMTVVFNDTFLDLNVANNTSTYQTDSGFRFARATSAANTISENAAFTYDASEDLFKFTRYTDSTTGAVANADNLLALKFDVTTSSLGAEAAASNDIADLYGTSASARSNNTNVRSLGGVSKCTINITTETTDGASNFAPVAAAANGYPIQHDLNTTSVFVVALKTKNSAGSVISEPEPVYVKYRVLTADVVEVKVGITQENEEYDIIVIG